VDWAAVIKNAMDKYSLEIAGEWGWWREASSQQHVVASG